MTTANGIDDTADLRRLLARLMLAEFPALALLTSSTYVVRKVYSDAPNYGRCDLALESDPEVQLPRVDQWPGIAGGVCLPVEGSLCEVTWRNGDPRSPIIVGFQASRLTAGIPNEVKINASALIELGGDGATALAKSAPIVTWAALVVSAITGLGGTCAGLADPAAVKVRGV